MTLVLEIEHLTGVAYAAIGQDSDVPDWPPQPDRVFSALVATWAARGQQSQEAAALEWLEAQPAPGIVASEALPRTAPFSFVPPNDPQTRKLADRGVMPALRLRQPRRFPAARPLDPVVRLYWRDARPDDATLAALGSIAADTSYVGHSASLTRCRFLRAEDPAVPPDAQAPRRSVYRGRLAELRRWFDSGKRPQAGAPVAAPPATVAALPHSVFAERWLLLEHVDGTMPDIRAAPLVAKAIRDTLLSGYRQIGRGDAVPSAISGHAPDGTPLRAPHLAVVPLAFVGYPHADGHVLGFALVPPREEPEETVLDDADFRRALRKLIVPIDKEREKDLTEPSRRALRLASGLALSPTREMRERQSLNPALYTRPARDFATLTPIVLDRHLKENGEARYEEIARLIAAACRNVGLPEPVAVVPDKHSAIEGAPSAWPSARSPAWMRWRLPETLASRALTHAVIRFAEPVQGPVILGAGRFVGLGLCRPIDGPSPP